MGGVSQEEVENKNGMVYCSLKLSATSIKAK